MAYSPPLLIRLLFNVDNHIIDSRPIRRSINRRSSWAFVLVHHVLDIYAEPQARGFVQLMLVGESWNVLVQLVRPRYLHDAPDFRTNIFLLLRKDRPSSGAVSLYPQMSRLLVFTPNSYTYSQPPSCPVIP